MCFNHTAISSHGVMITPVPIKKKKEQSLLKNIVTIYSNLL